MHRILPACEDHHREGEDGEGTVRLRRLRASRLKPWGFGPLSDDTMTNDKIRTSFLTDEETAKMLLDKREAYETKHQIQISVSAFISMMIRKYEDD